MNNKKKIIIIIITIVTIITLGGLTYAFFSANNVQGNSTTNTIVTLTADYGNVTITYDSSNGTITAANMDLKESEKGTHKEYLMKFKIASTASITHNISINWSNVTNTYCQYQKNGTCTGLNTDTYVGDELNYSLYECTQTDYNNATLANVKTNCMIAGNPYRSAPLTGETTALQNSEKISILPATTKYYVLVLRMENLIGKEQNYNQGKNFTGRIKVDYKTAWADNCKTNPNQLNCKIINNNSIYKDNEASTYVSASDGINFGAISSLTNGQGLYTNNKLEDGENYYFRGGTFCAYTDYAAEDTSGSKCIAAGGTWNTYTCSLDLIKTNCESKGFSWYELNNNVSFAGKYWKIIRVDEKGNIRLIYSGNATNATGANAQATTSAFNTYRGDTTYAGYMYKNNDIGIYQSGMGTWSSETSYYTTSTGTVKVGTSYTFNSTTGIYTLQNVSDGYYTNTYASYYTCFSASATTCNFMGQILVGELVSGTYYLRSFNSFVGYYTTSVEESTSNEVNSTIKGVVDTWYANNLSSYANKLADTGFCNDRTVTSGLGYGRESTYFGPYTRVYINKKPIYGCPDSNDLYTTKTSLEGNRMGTYPIGLITYDEVVYGGGLYNVANYTYYLQSGAHYWTQSPSIFYSSLSSAYAWHVYGRGYVSNNLVPFGCGVRPAVSLKSETTITGGTGTLTDPYIIAS